MTPIGGETGGDNTGDTGANTGNTGGTGGETVTPTGGETGGTETPGSAANVEPDVPSVPTPAAEGAAETGSGNVLDVVSDWFVPAYTVTPVSVIGDTAAAVVGAGDVKSTDKTDVKTGTDTKSLTEKIADDANALADSSSSEEKEDGNAFLPIAAGVGGVIVAGGALAAAVGARRRREER